MYKIKNFFTAISNLFKWLPIIWNDRQWDSHYYEIMLLKKIQLQRTYFEKSQFFIGWENEVKWMKHCEYLLTMLVERKYWEDKYDKMPSFNGVTGKWKEYYSCATGINGIGCDLWEYKARRLFWLIFVWRYERWWD